MREMSDASALPFVAEMPARTAKVATTRLDGRPHVAPVWVAVDGKEIVFNTAVDTLKGRTLRRDPRTSIRVDDDHPPFSFVIIEGEAMLSDDLTEVRHWAGVIGGRYMGEDRSEEFRDRNGVPGELLVRVRPSKIIAVRDTTD